jgi:hypothetical protein
VRVNLWKTPISADWKRDLELRSINAGQGGLVVEVAQESSDRSWLLEFSPIQAWKVTAWECAGRILGALPDPGSLFVIEDSPWIEELGNDTGLLLRSTHYVVCCYDEVVEVLAWEAQVRPKLT